MASSSTSDPTAMPFSGAQSITRAMRVLKLIGSMMPKGLTASEVAGTVGLTRPTAHRILQALTSEGFVDRDTMTGHWVLGPEMYLLGTVAADRYDVTDVAAEAVRQLAAETGESAFLSARRGNETVCLMREEGSFPVRSFVLYEGIRFPLGVASAGIAILAFESDEFVRSYVSRHDFTADFGPGHSAKQIVRRVEETRSLGYSLNPGLIVEGSWGMGAAVFSPAGRPEWALSITGVDRRFDADRRLKLGRLLLECAHKVTQQLRNNRRRRPRLGPDHGLTPP